MPMLNEFSETIGNHAPDDLGAGWINLEGYPTCPANVDPAEWREFIDGTPAFPEMTESEMIELAQLYGAE